MIDLFRSALWQLYQHWRDTLSCVACLSIGIAVVSSTASIVDNVLLRPLPFHDADRLVMIRSENPSDSLFKSQVSRIDFWDWQQDCKTMDMTVFSLGRIDLPHEGGYQRIFGLYVSPQFFEVLKIRPYLGSDFRDYEITGNWQQLMLSTDIWRRRYGGHSDVVGNMIKINSWASYPGPGSLSFALTGLLPEGMRFLPSSSLMVDNRGIGPDRSLDFVAPIDLNRGSFSFRNWRNEDALGRLKPGVTLAEAQAEMELICARLADRFPETNRGWTARVIPLHDYLFSEVRPFVVASLVAAMLVFAIAIANVVHVLLVQFQRRRSELAVRSAMGATPWSLFHLVFLEFSVLLVASLLLGLWLGKLCHVGLMAMAPQQLLWLPTTMNLGVILCTTLLAALSGVVVWCLALRKVISPHLALLLGSNGQTVTADESSVRLLGRMTQVQLVAVYLLVSGAGLLWIRTRQLSSVDPGFDSENRLTMVISLPAAKYEWKQNSIFNHEVIRRVENIPGVRHAAVVLGLPMGNSDLVGQLTIEGRPLIRRSDVPTTFIRVITDDYFEAMGIPLIAGRKFNATDSIGEIAVNRTAIISQTMVERCWPNVDPIGRRFKPFIGSHWMEVVGVVGDVRGDGIDRGSSIGIYYPEKLFPQSSPTLVVHTEADPMSMASQVRSAVLAADVDANIFDVKSMEMILMESQAERYFGWRLLSALSAIGFALAGSGIVLTTIHSIASQSAELMIRVACGATPWHILGLVLRKHMQLVVVALGGSVLLAATVVRSVELPWQDARILHSLILFVVPLMLLSMSLVAVLIVAAKLAFTSEKRIS